MWIHLVPLELIDGAGTVKANTYMTYESENTLLKTVVDSTIVSKQHANGNVDFINAVSSQSRDILRYILLQG